MPNAFVNQLAQAQVNQANPYANASNQTPNSQPWNNMVFDQVATDKRNMRGLGTAGGERGADYGDEQWYDNGANGAGFYRKQHGDEQALNAQQYYGKQFRDNIPQTENTLYNQLASSQNQNMNANIKGVQQQNSSRGLLYGGINAGQEQGVRAQTSGLLAQGRSSINSGVESAANQMDQGAINTGLAVQQQQQQIQNDIYTQALAKMNGVGSMVGNVLGAAGAVVGTIYGGGFGGMAGYQAGQAAGKALA